MNEHEDNPKFRPGELVYVDSPYYGTIRATVKGYYPDCVPPYVNLWMIDGFPGAGYTTTPNKVRKVTE